MNFTNIENNVYPDSPENSPPPSIKESQHILPQTWDEIENLDSQLLRGIFAYGFEKPSPIQQKTIPAIINGHDIVAQAQSGTGKTASFTIGGLSRIDVTKNETQLLIISPTKELTIQTAEVVKNIGHYMENLRIQTAYGGGSYTFDTLKPHVICGCPGRLFDMICRNMINPKTIRMIVLDEADELFSEGFKTQVKSIFQSLEETAQVVLFTATMQQHMDPIIEHNMKNPIHVVIKPEEITLEGIGQYYVTVFDDIEKERIIKHIYSNASISQSIIYCNSVQRVIDLYQTLYRENYPVCCIHSNMEKHVREYTFQDFKNGKYRILISTNLTARGIDVQQVSLVMNYDIPKDIFTYLHRIGRSGRWGRKGVAINFVTQRNTDKMREIETYYKCNILPLPEDISLLLK